MKKAFAAIAALSALFLALTPAQASTSKSATIVLPAPILGTTTGVNNGTTETSPTKICTPDTAGCQKGSYARGARCGYLTDKEAGTTYSQDSTSGKVGYVVAVPSGSTSFSLVASPAGSADFDVAFYVNLGTCDNGQAAAALGGSAPTPFEPTGRTIQSAWSHFGTGAESGNLPVGYKIDDNGTHTLKATYAIVTLYGATNAKFTLTFS